MKAVLLLLCLVVVLGQTPQPCVSPQQWEAEFQRIDQVRGQFQFGHFSYDSVRNRTAETIFVPGPPNSPPGQIWIIDLWHLNPPTRLQINQTANPWTCNKTNITYPFRYYGVGDATFTNEDIIGSSAILGGYVETTSWSASWANGTDHHTFTRRGCIPVSRVVVQNNTNPNDVRQDNWFDVVIGIPNPNIFVPPAVCNVTTV